MGRIRDLNSETEDWSSTIAQLHRRLIFNSVENAREKGLLGESPLWNQLSEIGDMLDHANLPSKENISQLLRSLLENYRSQNHD